MRSTEIFTALVLVLTSQAAIASTMTDEELTASSGSKVVEHRTAKGVIVCRDPQIEYNEKDWMRIGGPMGEHMLVDAIIGKKLLGKQRTFVDSLFKRSLIDVNQEHSIYNFYVYGGGAKCGNIPALRLEAIYNSKGELVKYRSRYYDDAGIEAPVQSDWVE